MNKASFCTLAKSKKNQTSLYFFPFFQCSKDAEDLKEMDEHNKTILSQKKTASKEPQIDVFENPDFGQELPEGVTAANFHQNLFKSVSSGSKRTRPVKPTTKKQTANTKKEPVSTAGISNIFAPPSLSSSLESSPVKKPMDVIDSLPVNEDLAKELFSSPLETSIPTSVLAAEVNDMAVDEEGDDNIMPTSLSSQSTARSKKSYGKKFVMTESEK